MTELTTLVAALSVLLCVILALVIVLRSVPSKEYTRIKKDDALLKKAEHQKKRFR